MKNRRSPLALSVRPLALWLLLAGLGPAVRVWAQPFVYNLGTPQYDKALGTCALPNGGLAVCGYFGTDLDFDPSTGTTTLTPAVNGTAFVAVYGPDGALQWARNWGSVANLTTATHVAYNPVTGGLVVAGSFKGTADFDPDPAVTALATLTALGGDDAYLLALAADGRYQWATHVGSPTTDLPTALAIATNGDALLGGTCQAQVRFAAGAPTQPGNGNTDGFVARYTATTGALQWAHVLGGPDDDAVGGLAANTADQPVVMGAWRGTMDIIPGTGEALVTSQGQDDLYLLALDSAGAYRWAALGQGQGSCSARALLQDPATGHLWALANFQGSIDTNPGPQDSTLATSGPQGILLWALTGAGDLRWAQPIEGINALLDATALARLPGGQLLVVGQLTGDLDLQTPQGPRTLDGGNGAALLASLNPTGSVLWGRTLANTNPDSSLSLAATAAPAPNGFYVAGEFWGPVDFSSPANGSLVRRSQGGPDIFWLKADSLTGDNGGGITSLASQPLSENYYGSITLWPNPLSGSLLTIDNPAPVPAMATLSDALGRTVLHLSLAPGPNTVEASALPPGLYLLYTPGFAPVRFVRY